MQYLSKWKKECKNKTLFYCMSCSTVHTCTTSTDRVEPYQSWNKQTKIWGLSIKSHRIVTTVTALSYFICYTVGKCHTLSTDSGTSPSSSRSNMNSSSLFTDLLTCRKGNHNLHQEKELLITVMNASYLKHPWKNTSSGKRTPLF